MHCLDIDQENQHSKQWGYLLTGNLALLDYFDEPYEAYDKLRP